jgi:hypothetical protein
VLLTISRLNPGPLHREPGPKSSSRLVAAHRILWAIIGFNIGLVLGVIVAVWW